MSIFASPHAIAARKAVTRCANCRHNEAIIADLQGWIADLRKSQRMVRLSFDAERAAGDAVRTEFGKFATTDSSRVA